MQLSLIIEEVRALFHRVYKLFSSTIFQVVNLAYDTDIVKVLVGFSHILTFFQYVSGEGRIIPWSCVGL